MSKDDARKFYEKAMKDADLRKDLKKAWGQVEGVARKHGYTFTHAEYFDLVHELSGMGKVGTSDSHDDTDTCITLIPSEPPAY